MFCTHCGAKLQEGALFCTECGEKIEVIDEKNQSLNQDLQVDAEVKEKKQYSKKTVGLIAGAVAMCVIIVLGIVTFLNRPKTLEINKYIKANFEGYDGYGAASLYFDQEQFLKDNKGIIEYKKGANPLMKAMYDSPEEALMRVLNNGQVSQPENLFNGNKVEYEWNIDADEVLKSFGWKLEYSKVEFEVSGLTKISDFDPFEAIQVKFEGTSPYAYAYIEYLEQTEDLPSLSYELDVETNLRIGDEVTVRAYCYYAEDATEYCMKYYGKRPSSLEKTYKVEQIPQYVDELAKIPSSVRNDMNSHVEYEFRNYAESIWSEHIIVNQIKNVGAYFFESEEERNYQNNVLVLVYRIDTSLVYDDYDVKEDFSLYYCVTYEDLILDADGSCNVDVDDCYSTSHYFSKYIQYGDDYGESDYFYFHGYESFKEITDAIQNYYINEYRMETDVR